MLTEAEKNRTSVAGYIEAAIRDALRPSHVVKLQAQARRHAVLQAWGEGLTDAQIAERTGELRNYVGDVRRDAKLPPNTVRQGGYRTPRKAG